MMLNFHIPPCLANQNPPSATPQGVSASRCEPEGRQNLISLVRERLKKRQHLSFSLRRLRHTTPIMQVPLLIFSFVTVLVNMAFGQSCNTNKIMGCVTTLTDTITKDTSIALDHSKLCNVFQRYVDCVLKQACNGVSLPESAKDMIRQTLSQYGINCNLNLDSGTPNEGALNVGTTVAGTTQSTFVRSTGPVHTNKEQLGDGPLVARTTQSTFVGSNRQVHTNTEQRGANGAAAGMSSPLLVVTSFFAAVGVFFAI